MPKNMRRTMDRLQRAERERLTPRRTRGPRQNLPYRGEGKAKPQPIGPYRGDRRAPSPTPQRRDTRPRPARPKAWRR